MTPEMLEHFRGLLIQERHRILNNSSDTLKHDMALSTDDMADENDLASVTYDQNFALRLRDRERMLLSKITLALRRIDDGEYGYCAICDDDIDPRRLEVRPVTTLCIDCKEDTERTERTMAPVLPSKSDDIYESDHDDIEHSLDDADEGDDLSIEVGEDEDEDDPMIDSIAVEFEGGEDDGIDFADEDIDEGDEDFSEEELQVAAD